MLIITPMHTKASDLWTTISKNPGTTIALLGALAATVYGAHTVAHAAGNDVQQRAEGITNHLGEVITTTVLPEAETRTQNTITHTANELQSVLQSTILGCCWIGIAFFGLKVAYDGISAIETIPEEKSRIKSLQTLKVTFGIACASLATYALYTHTHLKPRVLDTI